MLNIDFADILFQYRVQLAGLMLACYLTDISAVWGLLEHYCMSTPMYLPDVPCD